MAFFANPTDWYFVIGADQTQVFHSGRGLFVPVADSAYVTWKAVVGNVATVLPGLTDLGTALAQFLVRPTDASVLDAYTGVQADVVLQHLPFKILFNHENRLRAIERQLVLNGSPPNLTAPQARAAIKALM